MDFGLFGILNVVAVLVPFALLLCVFYYFHSEIRDRLCLLEEKIVKCKCECPPKAEPAEKDKKKKKKSEEEPPNERLEEDLFLSEDAEAIGRSILDSMGPILTMTVEEPTPVVRRRGRRPKSCSVVIESPSASEITGDPVVQDAASDAKIP